MKKRAAYFAVYTLIFMALACHIFYVFHENGRSFIWDRDGLYQTYTTMVYFSEYWKEFFRNLWIKHEFILPMVDLRVGLGSDVMTTLNHYGFGDPLLIFSIPVSEAHMEQCYAFLAVLRYYLAGAAFSAYCFYMKRRELPTLVGALCYAFCGFALYAGVRHPYFLNSMWYFPLMLCGVEQVFRRRKGVLLVFVTAVAACSNFYFLYLLTFLTFLYAMVRFACLERERNGKNFFYIIKNGCGCYFLGIGLGAVFLLPGILAFLGNARGGIKERGVESLLHYGLDFYNQMLAGVFAPEFTASYWTILSLAPMAAFGIVLVFTAGRRRDRWLRAMFAVLTLLLLIPAGGLFLNGFSYVSNRWIYGYAFFLSFAAVRGLELLPFMGFVRALWPGLLLPAVGLAAWKNGGFFDRLTIQALWLAALTYLLFVLYAAFRHVRRGRKVWHRRLFYGACGSILAVSAAAVSVNARALYSPEHGDYVSEFHPSGQALAILGEGAELEAASLGDEGVYRVDGDSIDVVNNGMVYDLNTTGGFFSIVSDDIFQYMKAMEVDDIKFPNWYYGFGGRAALNTLAAVKYYGNNAGTALAVPYGYEPVGGSGSLYENTLALPLAYTYDRVMDRMEFMMLPAVRRQEAMMQAAVLDGIESTETAKSAEPETGSAGQSGDGMSASAGKTTDVSGSTGKAAGVEKIHGVEKVDGAALQYDAEELPWTISSMENMTWNQETGELIVEDAGGGDLYLEFEGKPDSETYLRFGNYDINGSGYELLTVSVECGDAYWKKFYEASTMSVWYGDLHNFIVNLGWRQEARTKVHILFPFEGAFRLDSLKLFSVPMDSYGHFMRERSAERFEDCAVRGNQVSGNISVDAPRMLVFAIPYSEGWSARVDGEETPVYKANLMFMAVPLEAGRHTVELSYCTPGIRAGAAISGLCAAIFVVFLLWGGRALPWTAPVHRERGASRGKRRR